MPAAAATAATAAPSASAVRSGPPITDTVAQPRGGDGSFLGVAIPLETIYARVRRVPPGFVTTYGDLSPGAPRHAGRALSQMPADLPWWRVVRRDGSWPKGEDQRARLLAEEVPIRGQRVVMTQARIPPEAIH
jgi:methylated-DNA-protein-cysteine methyltransferase-like protein